MKKPISRLLYPNTIWYIAAMLLFVAAAAAFRQYYLAAGAFAVTLIVFIVSRVRFASRKRQLMSYVQTATDSVGISVHAGSAFPILPAIRRSTPSSPAFLPVGCAKDAPSCRAIR